MIRQGGNHLVLKVVTVTRTLDPDDTARKKGLPCPRGREGRQAMHSWGGRGHGPRWEEAREDTVLTSLRPPRPQHRALIWAW